METASPWTTVRGMAAHLNSGQPADVFTPDSLRHLVREADVNGLAPHIRRIGAKVLINGPAFMEWLERQPSKRQRRGRR